MFHLNTATSLPTCYILWYTFNTVCLFQILSSYICGTNKDYLIESPANVTDIHFFSDNSVTGSGFVITYREINGNNIKFDLFTAGTPGSGGEEK